MPLLKWKKSWDFLTSIKFVPSSNLFFLLNFKETITTTSFYRSFVIGCHLHIAADVLRYECVLCNNVTVGHQKGKWTASFSHGGDLWLADLTSELSTTIHVLLTHSWITIALVFRTTYQSRGCFFASRHRHKRISRGGLFSQAFCHWKVPKSSPTKWSSVLLYPAKCKEIHMKCDSFFQLAR